MQRSTKAETSIIAELKIFNAPLSMPCSCALRALGSAETPIDLTCVESEGGWEAWKARFGVDEQLLEPSRWRGEC